MKYSFVFFLIAMTFLSCKKESPIASEERRWEKFIGTYNVTKAEDSTSYTMTVAHLGTDTVGGWIVRDSLSITNYGDLFSLTIYFASNGGYSDDRVFRPHGGNPTTDKFGERWAFSVNAQDTTTEELENILVNDSLLLYFNLNNVAYYYHDDVPFYECKCKHWAVKVD